MRWLGTTASVALGLVLWAPPAPAGDEAQKKAAPAAADAPRRKRRRRRLLRTSVTTRSVPRATRRRRRRSRSRRTPLPGARVPRRGGARDAMGRGRRTSMPVAGRAWAAWRRSPPRSRSPSEPHRVCAVTPGIGTSTTTRVASMRWPVSPAPTATVGTRASATPCYGRRHRPSATGATVEVRALFALTEHHKVDQGVVSCIDCHQPHGTRNVGMLKAANDRTCYKCHGDLEGPFVFEHVGLVTEGCQRCHVPARRRESPPPDPPAGRPALLRVPHRHAGESHPAELSRLHAVPREHPRVEHQREVPAAMMRRVALLLGLTAGLAPTPARAVELPYTVKGDVAVGYRNVDVDGSDAKYREDYNYRSGFRLFDLNVDGVAKEPAATRLDRFHLQIDTPGDEPVSTFRLTASDRTLYDFRVSFIRSKYYYAVPELWQEPVAGDVRLDDLHHFNTLRWNGAVDLTVRAPHLPTLFFGYRLYKVSGGATSTVLIPAGDTFVVNAPTDSVTNVGKVGTEFKALGTSVFLQQEYRRITRSFDQNGPPQSGRRRPDGRIDDGPVARRSARAHRPAGDHGTSATPARGAGRPDGRLLLQPRQPDVRRVLLPQRHQRRAGAERCRDEHRPWQRHARHPRRRPGSHGADQSDAGCARDVPLQRAQPERLVRPDQHVRRPEHRDERSREGPEPDGRSRVAAAARPPPAGGPPLRVPRRVLLAHRPADTDRHAGGDRRGALASLVRARPLRALREHAGERSAGQRRRSHQRSAPAVTGDPADLRQSRHRRRAAATARVGRRQLPIHRRHEIERLVRRQLARPSRTASA